MSTTVDHEVSFQHLVLTDVPWSYYEQTLDQVGDGHIRINYLDGMMEIMSPGENPFPEDYLLWDDVPWKYYEATLRVLRDRPLQVTYLDGRMEIMSPLPKHERRKKAIARLLELLSLELDIPMMPFGSTTFRREEQMAGLEPDECYYIQNEAKVHDMERFDPAAYPPPDLAIEVDVTGRSVAREPIYARLGIPELWRHRKSKFVIRGLQSNGTYRNRATSLAFPFLPMAIFEKFVNRMLAEPQHLVLREFREWVRTLKRT